MKTHIPASLRKALLAALFATVASVTTAQGKDTIFADVVNHASSSIDVGGSDYSSVGYTDLTFDDSSSYVGSVVHRVHLGTADYPGEDYSYITVPYDSSGVFYARSITAQQGKDPDATIVAPYYHDHDGTPDRMYGYSPSWSNGNINVYDKVVLEVTNDITAHGAITILESSRVNAGLNVSAGDISVDNAELTAKDINVTTNSLWNPGQDNSKSDGDLTLTSGANVTATGKVYTEGVVNVSAGSRLSAKEIESVSVGGKDGYIVGLDGEDIEIDSNIISERGQYIVGEGCGIAISGDIGEVNEGTVSGNYNAIGYSAEESDYGTTLPAAAWVNIFGGIQSDGNKIGATGKGGNGYKNAITVSGNISGDDNRLELEGIGVLFVNGRVSGDGNVLSSANSLHLGQGVGRSYDDDGPAYGNNLNAKYYLFARCLLDNQGLIVSCDEGLVKIDSSSGTLDSSKIEAGGDVLINYDKKSPVDKSSDVLTLVWGSTIISNEGDIVINQNLRAGGAKLSATEGDITLYGGLRHVVDGVNDYGITVDTQNLYSGGVLELNGTPLGGTQYYVDVVGDIRSDSDIFITGYNGEKSYVSVGGTMQTYGRVEVDNSLVNVDTRVVSDWNLIAKGGSHVTVNVGTEGLEEGETSVLDVRIIEVDETSTLRTGNVELDDADETIKGIVEVGDIQEGIQADWKVTGSHTISGSTAHLNVNGDAAIMAGDDGRITIDDGATVSAAGDVTIQGLAAVLAEVDSATVHANGDIILDNAKITNNDTAYITDITTKGSDIVLKNRVEISDTILNVLPPEEGEAGVINVAEGADVQIVRSLDPDITANINVFNGRLAGTGNITANDYGLTLYHDATAFNGVIRMETEEHDIEQALYIACEGVGEDATIYLKEGNALYTYLGGQDAHLGNVVADDGSHIQLAAVEEGKGNRATATSLNMTSGATYEVLATTDENGAMVSDCITVSRGIDANGAKVAAHTTDDMETMADGTRYTIAAGEVVTGFNEDVLYDRVKPIGGGASTLRALQTRNLHLEHTANGVDLVVSENYKGINSKNANVNAVREIIMPLDAAADHRPGVLAASTSNLDHILDALDYTRSGGDAKKGLLSVSAAANLIVPNMMMDSTRHHLSTLRDHINAPVCSKTVNSKGNVWAAYSGGHDYIGGDDNMDKYSHNYNGAIIGGDYAVNCNWAIGLSAGYEGSIARTTGTRADVNTTFIDAYAVGRTGNFIHKFSVGVGIHRSDMTRATNIAAKGHDYHGVSTGKVKSTSVNFGYDVARLYAIDETSSISPFFAVDLGIQNLKDLNEKGQEDASVVTKYKNFTQLDAALGVSYAHTFQAFAQQAGVFSVSLAMHSEFSAHRATADNHFVDTPEDKWKTRSAKRAPFYGELGGNVLVPFTEHFSGTAGMSFEFSADRTYIGGHAGVNYRF